MRKFRGMRAAGFILFVFATVLPPAVAQDVVGSSAATQNNMDQARQYIDKTIDRHVAYTEKQLDAMRASMKDVIDARLQAYNIWQTILLAVAAVVVYGIVYSFKMAGKLKSLRNEMSDNMRRVSDVHADLEKSRRDMGNLYRLFRERANAFQLLWREHLKTLDGPGQLVDQLSLEQLLRDVYIIDLLYSGHAGYVTQAVSQINNSYGVGSAIGVICRGIKVPLAEIYGNTSQELVTAIERLNIERFCDTPEA